MLAWKLRCPTTAARRPTCARRSTCICAAKPEDAPVRALLATPAVEGKLAAFDAADAVAIREQRAYRRVGRFSLWCMLIGALVGAIALLPLGAWIDGLPRKVIAAPASAGSGPHRAGHDLDQLATVARALDARARRG